MEAKELHTVNLEDYNVKSSVKCSSLEWQSVLTTIGVRTIVTVLIRLNKCKFEFAYRLWKFSSPSESRFQLRGFLNFHWSPSHKIQIILKIMNQISKRNTYTSTTCEPNSNFQFEMYSTSTKYYYYVSCVSNSDVY